MYGAEGLAMRNIIVAASKFINEYARQLISSKSFFKPKNSLPKAEKVQLLIFPITLLFGQAIRSADILSNESLLSSKDNFLNTVFVMHGWLWTSLASTLILACHVFALGHIFESPDTKYSSAIIMFLRYIAATLWWVISTQWFFGIPLIDKIFIYTGGHCQGTPDMPLSPGSVISAATCRAHNGIWTGGFDISGHAFLLTHSSLFLLYELYLLIQRKQANELALTDTPISTNIRPNSIFSTILNQVGIILSTYRFLAAVFLLIILWWWMFLMTALYFHTFTEKLCGLLWAYIEISLVYVLFE